MSQTPESLKEQLGLDVKPTRSSLILKIVAFVILFALFAWGVNTFYPKEDLAPIYKMGNVSRGDIRATVSTTGTIQPTNEVEVGSELSGTVDEVLVDYNSPVKKGQLLARLNTDKLKAQVLQTRAALKVAKAGVIEAEASLQEANAEYERLVEVRKLSGGKLPSKADFISANAAKERAQATKTTAEAQVEQAQANLDQNLTDLSKANIVSPINGIVLERSIEPGQTVAATMSAPVLFTLAEDLTKMELEADVDEADVGQVAEGQTATFTVDAYPNQEFPAIIKQVRYGSETTDGVVTYTSLLEVSNQDLKLRPGMTATANILVKEKKDVLKIPIGALRFTPELIGQAKESKSIIESLSFRPPSSKGEIIKVEVENGYKKVWQLVNGKLESIKIKVGDSDGGLIEVTEGDLKEGEEIITGVEVPTK
ncbi:efflux RND transporter periplasmic adaptor subunit [Thiomicrorhabdus sp. Kp2]|uniref:efflux RND transporter periplasmic adaptor subunit n=1 Tax=Thiomicrorhabdus sp. Kp2 TaxID=1123518 RepID=UPI00042806FF|nr:efflux RND transporter periplasmic adaptor subunit [Thiomicrorhabdus sp. Kp2]